MIVKHYLSVAGCLIIHLILAPDCITCRWQFCVLREDRAEMVESVSVKLFFLGLGLVGDPMLVAFTPPLLALGLGLGLEQVLMLPADCALYMNAGKGEGVVLDPRIFYSGLLAECGDDFSIKSHLELCMGITLFGQRGS